MDFCENCSRNVSEVVNNLDPFIALRFRLMKTAKSQTAATRLVFILKLFPATAKHPDTKQMKLSTRSEIN